jgi:hypothetical protein
LDNAAELWLAEMVAFEEMLLHCGHIPAKLLIGLLVEALIMVPCQQRGSNIFWILVPIVLVKKTKSTLRAPISFLKEHNLCPAKAVVEYAYPCLSCTVDHIIRFSLHQCPCTLLVTAMQKVLLSFHIVVWMAMNWLHLLTYVILLAY